MRLILLFSIVPKDFFEPDDIVLTSQYYLDNLEFSGKKYTIDKFEIPHADFLAKFDNAKIDFYKKNKIKEKVKQIYESSLAAFYNHTFGNCVKWQFSIEQLIEKYDPSEIIISDGVPGSEYLPFYEAEGEKNQKLFYEDYDFVPTLLHQWLIGKDVKVKYRKKRSKIKQWFRIFVRRYLLLQLMTFLLIKKKVSSLWNQKKYSKTIDNTRPPKFIFVSRGFSHLHYMLPFIQEYGEDSTIHVADGFVSGNENLNYCSTIKDLNYVSSLQFSYFKDIFRIYIETTKALLQAFFSGKKIMNVNGLEFNMTSCLKEMIIFRLDVLIYVATIERYIEKLKDRNDNINLCVITAELLTPYPLAIKEMASRQKIKCTQLQTVDLPHKPQTNFIFCDKFLFRSYKDFENYFVQKNLSTKYMDYWGIIGKQKEMVDRPLKSIIYFSQPFEKENELLIIDTILESLPHVDLHIKLHPRESGDFLEGYLDRIKIIPKHLNLDEYIDDFELAVMRYSAIARGVILNGVPLIFCLFTDFARGKVSDLHKKSYGGVCYSKEDFKLQLADNIQLRKDYSSFRNNYLQESKLNLDSAHLKKNLENYLIE